MVYGLPVFEPLPVDITLTNGNTKENFSAVAETRDPWLWPFAQDSIWNTPIGSNAVYAPANFEPNATLGGDNVYLLQLDNANPARPVYGHDSFKMSIPSFSRYTSLPTMDLIILVVAVRHVHR